MHQAKMYLKMLPSLITHNTLIKEFKGLCKHCILNTIWCVLLCILASICLPAKAQKAYKPIKIALKDKNYNEAIKQIDKLKADTNYCFDSKLYLYAIEANRGLNDAQNMKMYLKQNYDTTAFFSTTFQVVINAIRIDSIENENKDKQSKDTKLQRIAYDNIHHYMPNINAAARFFYKNKKYNDALQYLRLSLDLPYTTTGEKSNLNKDKEAINAVIYLSCAYYAKKYAETTRYKDLALSVNASKPMVIKYLALSANALNDTTNYKKWLIKGCKEYPNEPVFFTNLVDFYNQNRQYANTISVANQQLKTPSLHIAAYLAKSVAYYETQQYDSCIVNADKVITNDSANAIAYYYKGASFVGKVSQFAMPSNITSQQYKKALSKRQSFYSQAEPLLEKFRELSPNSIKLWGPLLYDTYYALNRGKKFAEIEDALTKYMQTNNP